MEKTKSIFCVSYKKHYIESDEIYYHNEVGLKLLDNGRLRDIILSLRYTAKPLFPIDSTVEITIAELSDLVRAKVEG